MRKDKIDPSTMGELTSSVVTIKRVTKVVKGGRNFRFTALVVVGDKNGHVGFGLGKAMEIPEAIRKGEEAAKKTMITVARTESGSIPHDILGVFGSAQVLLKSAPEGTGVIAGGTKSLGSNNKNNVVAATLKGLSALKTPEEVASIRGKSVAEILG